MLGNGDLEFAEFAKEAFMNYGEVDFDDKIINELRDKEKCVNDLLSKKGNDYVKKLLVNFKGESEFDIKIQSKDNVYSERLKVYVGGQTSPPDNGLITITIRSSKSLSNSSLGVARTILHEYIHADIFRKLKTKYPTSDELDFRKSYEEYESQHGTMAAIYVASMREALKGFHKSILTDDFNKYTVYYEEEPSDDFYEALAWQGLSQYGLKAWTDLSDERRNKLTNLSLRVATLTNSICPN
ncbi:hypothetical protein [Algibacter sp. R77976]|uniref:hypothetical protein n=1 Tax=Algibacter sp. R77976 TaxID=3093873 RepID=UPI0037CC9772